MKDCRRKVPSAPEVQKVNSAIYWVSHYLMHKGVGILIRCSLVIFLVDGAVQPF